MTPASNPPLVDIHVVARTMSSATLKKLIGLGYDAKKVVGGDPRVKMNHLLSVKHTLLTDSDKTFSDTAAICKTDEDFHGYIEQEIISDDLKLRSAGTVSLANLNDTLEVSACPDNMHKGCDLHFALVNVEATLFRKLEAYGLYYLTLNKDGLGDVTVFTMQFERVVEGRNVWQVMLDYLRSLPNVDCDAKFEVTRNLVRIGDYPLPPLVLKSTHPSIDV